MPSVNSTIWPEACSSDNFNDNQAFPASEIPDPYGDRYASIPEAFRANCVGFDEASFASRADAEKGPPVGSSIPYGTPLHPRDVMRASRQSSITHCHDLTDSELYGSHVAAHRSETLFSGQIPEYEAQAPGFDYHDNVQWTVVRGSRQGLRGGEGNSMIATQYPMGSGQNFTNRSAYHPGRESDLDTSRCYPTGHGQSMRGFGHYAMTGAPSLTTNGRFLVCNTQGPHTHGYCQGQMMAHHRYSPSCQTFCRVVDQSCLHNCIPEPM